MVRQVLFVVVIGIAGTIQGAGQAAPAAVDPVMPEDANAAMQLAARVNGLGRMDKPWHLKADYQTFDEDGKPKDQGVFEEWWAGPEKYKISYADTGFHQVDYKNGEKAETLGDSGWATEAREMVRTYLNDPLPNEREVVKEDYSAHNLRVGKVNLRCMEPKSSEHHPGLNGAPDVKYCFDLVLPAIRLEDTSSFLLVLFNGTERINGHYLAQQIAVENGNLPIVNIKITSLETLSSAEEAMFAPAPTAVAGPGPRVKAAVIAGNKIGGVDPRYPIEARRDRVQGMVMLEATINKVGDIENLQIVSGPKELRESAFDAVKTWRYKPYLLNGQPVAVRTQVNVVYTLGG